MYNANANNNNDDSNNTNIVITIIIDVVMNMRRFQNGRPYNMRYAHTRRTDIVCRRSKGAIGRAYVYDEDDKKKKNRKNRNGSETGWTLGWRGAEKPTGSYRSAELLH